ncbi:MAG TPA: ATP-grasp domain-containing protein [Usitatibacter sp.]|nr:ATP-grasp domain-containing protein [Usitatibacter sp.]
MTIDLPAQGFDRARPPAVLLGGINLVRALGLAGIPAIVASSNPDEPAFASRHCAGRCHLPSFENREAVVAALVELGDRLARQLGRRVPLVYGSDDALELLYAHQDRLQRYYLFLVSDPRVGNSLIAKDRFQRLALQRGLPVPTELAWDGEGPGSLRGTTGPVLVKPRNKVDWHHSTLCERLFGGDGKARIFQSGQEAAAHPDVARHREELTFQQYIAGGDADLWSYHGFADERGEVIAGFVGRKVRTYPTLTGESAFIEMAHDESLEAIGREVARRCPLKGVFKMDFKRDASSGKWYLLEINARFTLWHYLAARNGMNLMQVACEYLLDGRRPGQHHWETRYRWLNLELDVKAFRELAARGELRAAAWLASLLGSRKVYSVFAWDDPRPWIFFWQRRIARKRDRAGARLAMALRQWRSTAS